MRPRRQAARAAFAQIALTLCLACAGRVEPVVDLTPWTWSWSQLVRDGWVIRYAYPESPSDAPAAADPVGDAMPQAAAVASGSATGPRAWSAARLASYHYDCAREDRSEDAACSVFLDFWLLSLEPPLAGVGWQVYQGRFERSFGAPPPLTDGVIVDARGREWLHRAVAYASGAEWSHYSRPLDARTALAVTSYTTRAPDRVVARDLARDAVERIRIEAVR